MLTVARFNLAAFVAFRSMDGPSLDCGKLLLVLMISPLLSGLIKFVRGKVMRSLNSWFQIRSNFASMLRSSWSSFLTVVVEAMDARVIE
jgi:hypothetical protein